MILEGYIILAVASGVLYLWVILRLQQGFLSFSQWRAGNGWSQQIIPDTRLPGISVVLAVRNEEMCIVSCVSIILDCNYPEGCFEVIVVDDHSTDKTRELLEAREWNGVRLLPLPEGVAGKKAAISWGVAHARYSYIACTDADCLVPDTWLRDISCVLHHPGVNMATGIVLPALGQRCLDAFQRLDMAGTMVLTACGIQTGKWQLANGASMAFRKDFFTESGGFAGNEHVASGDDVYLAANAVKYGNHGLVFFTGEKPVVTKSEASWAALWMQRKRWASKSLLLPGTGLLQIQGIVFVLSFFSVASLPLAIFMQGEVIWLFLLLSATKMLGDGWLLLKFRTLTGMSLPMRWFPVVFWIYYWHILQSGFNAFFRRGYYWKGRQWQVDKAPSPSLDCRK